MSYCTLFLLYLFTILEYSHALDPSIQVTSGVFMTKETNLDYVNATTICKNYENSTLASLDKVQVALKNGYEACRWGWIQEENLVMLRITMSPNCSNNSLGLITKNCVARKSEYTYCIKNGVSNLLYDASLEGPNSNFTEATLTCLMNGDTVPTLSAIQTTSNRNITFNRYAWYNWGVGLIAINGTFQNMPCYYGSQAGAFCYNPNLPDTIQSTNDTTLKRIVMGCVLGSIFLILLFAGVFMKGNRFICCVKEKPMVHTDVPPEITVPSPTWNKTSSYTPLRKDSRYINLTGFAIDKRPPIIRPDIVYQVHMYDNTGYDRTGDE